MSVIFQSLRFFLVMTCLFGVVYPVLVTGIGQFVFPKQANGSLLMQGGKLAGSELFGQDFKSNQYFWSRPSAGNYQTVPSSASNLGPTSKLLASQVKERAEIFRKNHGLQEKEIVPSEMLFASGSGLDPHISPKAAELQVARVVQARGFNDKEARTLHELVAKSIELPQWGIFGKARVNVLRLNLALDQIRRGEHDKG